MRRSSLAAAVTAIAFSWSYWSAGALAKATPNPLTVPHSALPTHTCLLTERIRTTIEWNRGASGKGGYPEERARLDWKIDPFTYVFVLFARDSSKAAVLLRRYTANVPSSEADQFVRRENVVLYSNSSFGLTRRRRALIFRCLR